MLNKDFRGVGEVIAPASARELQGWSGERDIEQRQLDSMASGSPDSFADGDSYAAPAELLEAWEKFQRSKGRYEGSNDLSLLDEFVHGQPLVWKPQIIGSCVVSNTLRPWVARLMYQVAILGQPMEYLGRSEHGPQNYSPFGPMSYGLARKRANMRGSDGLYCAPMAESLLKDGVLPCSNSALADFMEGKGFTGITDLPEPQGRDGARLYRDFGNWRHLDELRSGLTCKLANSPTVRDADHLWDLAMQGKPAFVCSMEAIHKTGEHPDGFAIHARDPRDRWAHNMSFQGGFVASDGERFFRQSNESWGKDHIYNRRFEEVAESFRKNRLTVQAIGQIKGPETILPEMA